MRFLADESCAGRVVRALREAGHDVTSVRDTIRGASDKSVLDAALRERRLLLTPPGAATWRRCLRSMCRT